MQSVRRQPIRSVRKTLRDERELTKRRLSVKKRSRDAWLWIHGSLLNKSTKAFSRPTKEVYNGKWEMPCDLPEDTWVEVHVRVFERLGRKYGHRFEARPVIIWVIKGIITHQDPLNIPLRKRNASSTLASFSFQESKSSLKSKLQKWNFLNWWKEQRGSRMYYWAATEKVPRREKFIQYGQTHENRNNIR